MPSINSNRCFLPQKERPKNALKDLPKDWLAQLNTLCGQLLNLSPKEQEFWEERMSFHVGERSTYSLKEELLDDLKEIWFRFHGAKEFNITKSQQLAIAMKVQEGIGPCTMGFHNRVSEIAIGFVISTDLDGLLYQERQALVAKTAHPKINEVHAYNRFFTVARMIGYGTNPLNNKDAYRGGISDATIGEALTQTFAKEYTPFIILNRLNEAIKNRLHLQYEYQGRKKPKEILGSDKKPFYIAYAGDECEQFNRYLQGIFGADWVGDAYIMDEETSAIVDLDWKVVKKHLFNKLVENEYLHCSPLEKACMAALLEGQEPEGLFAFAQTSVKTVDDLKSLLAFLNHLDWGIQCCLIEAYFNGLESQQGIEFLFDIMDFFSANEDALAFIKNYFREQITAYNRHIPSLLCEALDNSHHSKVAFLSNYLKKLPLKEQALILFQSYEGIPSVLTHVLKFYPSLAKFFLDSMRSLSGQEVIRILTQVDQKGNNVWITALLSKPGAVEPLLDVINTLPVEEQIKILNQANGEKNNTLGIAIKYQPETVAAILNLVSQWPILQQEQFLIHKSDKRDLFDKPEAFLPFLNLIRLFPPKRQMELLTQSDQYNDYLYLAKQHPNIMERVLDLVSQWPLEQQGELLTSVMDSYGNNIVMHVLDSHQPKAISRILELVASLPIEQREKILTHSSKTRENILWAAIANPYVPLEPILDLMHSLPLAQQKELLSDKNGHSILAFAAMWKVKKVTPILRFIRNHRLDEELDCFCQSLDFIPKYIIIKNEWLTSTAQTEPELIAFLVTLSLKGGYLTIIDALLKEIGNLPLKTQNKIYVHMNLDKKPSQTLFNGQPVSLKAHIDNKVKKAIDAWAITFIVFFPILLCPFLALYGVAEGAYDYFKQKRSIAKTWNKMEQKIELAKQASTSHSKMKAIGFAPHGQSNILQESENKPSITLFSAKKPASQEQLNNNNEMKPAL